jgi:O-antigen/teichoic acid export membrane protein
MVYLARYLGPANYGIIIFAVAFTGIFAVLADFGLQQLTVREIARNREQVSKYIVNVSMLRIILVVITYRLLAPVINDIVYLWHSHPSFSIPVLITILRGHERMGRNNFIFDLLI